MVYLIATTELKMLNLTVGDSYHVEMDNCHFNSIYLFNVLFCPEMVRGHSSTSFLGC